MTPGYRALHEGAAWRDVSDRGRLRIIGEDRARLLHAMTTNHIKQLTPGTGCYAFFLSAQGRILADANVLCRPDHFLLDTEPETREKIAAHLDKFIIADDVTVEDLTNQTGSVALAGPASEKLLKELGAPVPETDLAQTEWSQHLIVRLAEMGSFLLISTGGKEALIQELERAGAIPATAEDARVVRIEQGIPRYSEDITERYLAQETNQARALHFQKGCYLGQEIVERVRSRGQIHRVLTPLTIDAAEPPTPGTKLQSGEGKDVAEITSAAFSPTSGKVAALAYVRVEQAPPGTILHLGEMAATVIGGASASC
ncbi:MAG: YgfZ/GcvT domain-containing protein [Bryobacteraceae bacterium]